MRHFIRTGFVPLWTVALLFGPTAALPAEQETYQRTYTDDAGRVIVEADAGRLHFTDRLRLRLQVVAPIETTVTFPPVSETLGPFRIVERQVSNPLATGEHDQLWRQEFVLEPDEAGDLLVPSLVFSLQPAEPNAGSPCAPPDDCDQTSGSGAPPPRQIHTEPIPVSVIAAVPDGADLTVPRDIAPPLRAEPADPSEDPPHGWIWWLAAVAAGVGGLAAIALRARRRRSPPSLGHPRPSHELALEALARLRHRGLLDQKRFDEFYVALSGVLRRYLQYRFGLSAPYRTTEEVGASLRVGGPISNHAAWLDAVLRQSDAVKFARHRPTRDEAIDALDTIVVFLQRTADSTVLAPAETMPGER